MEERELIAGYVSGVNACQYCHGVHSQVAIALGFPQEGFVKLMEDVETSDVDGKMKPVLKYVRKLTLTPSKNQKSPSAPSSSFRSSVLSSKIYESFFLKRSVLLNGIVFFQV